MSQLPLRGALIGAGGVSAFHLYAWERLPQATIVAVADPDLVRAQQRAAEHGIGREHVYGDLEALLQGEPRLDFVDITAPPESHVALVEQAAAHHLHICCQKPFAQSLGEARRMMTVARQAGVVLHVHENWRWRSWYRQVRRSLDEGRIGRPVYARIFSHSGAWLPGKQHEPEHRFYRWERTIFYDWGTHHVDVLRFLFGDVATVYARTAGLHPEMAADDRALVLLTFCDDARLTAIVDLSWSSFASEGHTNRHRQLLEAVRIEGALGTIRFITRAAGDELVQVVTAAGVEEHQAYSGAPYDAYRQSYVDALDHFVTSLLAGRRSETDAEDNYETLSATLAAYEAAERNQVVRVAEFQASQEAG
jgi:D-apiose dehydrogenase